MALYLDQQLECPYCLTIRLRIPADVEPATAIACDDCGEYLGTWDELQTDFEDRVETTECSSLRKAAFVGSIDVDKKPADTRPVWRRAESHVYSTREWELPFKTWPFFCGR